MTELTTRTATWSNIGSDVTECKDVSSVLQASNLDYDVVKLPVQTTDGIVIPNRFITARPSDDGMRYYDIVSDKFELVQNRDAFDFVNYMSEDIVFEKAGETANGMVYIIGKLEAVSILGDSFVPHVLFRNGFTGKVKVTAAICPLRIVCQNQFNMAFQDATNTTTIRHVQNIYGKLEEAKETLKVAATFMQKLSSVAEQYAGIRMGQGEIDRVIDTLFPIVSEPDKQINSFKLFQLESHREAFKKAYMAEDNANFRGTAWGLVNAYTDFVTHRDTVNGTPESKFITTTTKGNMNLILDVVRSIAA